MTNLEKIVEELSSLTVIQAAELSKMLEEKWGVSATPVMASAPVAAANVEAAAEKTAFDVVLVAIGDKKLEVITQVRAATGLDLKKSKELVEQAPQTLKSGLSKTDAEALKVKLEATGAKVEIK